MSPYDTDECGVSLQGNRDPLEALSRLGESLVAEGDRLPLGDGDISADARDEQSPYSNALEFGLYNMKRPSCGVEIVHEKPEHRIILFLKAQGHSHTEIAKITGYTIPWISQIVRQPWARERLMRILTEQGEDAVQAVLRGEVLNSVFTLIEVRDTAANPAVQIGRAHV